MVQMEYASRIERKIAKALVDTLLEAGLELQVHDGWETTTPVTADKTMILNALCTADSDTLRVFKEGSRIGGVLLVWGNEEDLISDYTDTPVLNDLLDGWIV